MSRFTPTLAVIAASLFVLPAYSQSKADTATPANSGLAADVLVNGKTISRNHVQLMLTSINPDPSARGAGSEEARTAARQELVTQELLAQEARRKGLDKTPAVADQLAYQERAILSRALLQESFEKNPVTTAELKSAYEWNRANGKIVEVKIRQILVSTPDQAEAALARLNKGEDFAAVAETATQDPGGQNNGGDLGWFRPDIFVDHHFTDALAQLKKGEYTKAPVKTRFGWHLLKVEDGPRAVSNAESFDTLDDSAQEALRQKTVQLRIETLTTQLAAKARLGGPGAGAVARAGK
ncbi:MAG: peptidylprolyl isomerase [Panacagrimonas sp.]|jgi:peptidyl-prolyl cis-trans isomerase C|nr:peptidylprolyl isomerase [Panacagrimonas sp.]MCC2656341.1 peptidylprolyl isomerase [Panacagrimonas sp.]